MPKRKKKFLDKLIHPIVLKEQFESQCSVWVAEPAYTAEEINKLPALITRRLYRKGERFLRKHGCVCVAPEEACAKAFGLPCNTGRGLFQKIPQERLLECAVWAWNRFLDKPFTKVCVKEKHLSSEGKQMLMLFCPYASFFTVCTEEISAAEKFAEDVCTRFGVYPEIKSVHADVSGGTLVIDMDERWVRAGRDLFIDGMEVFADFKGYAVDMDSYFSKAELLPEGLRFGYWLSGKKRLTMNEN